MLVRFMSTGGAVGLHMARKLTITDVGMRVARHDHTVTFRTVNDDYVVGVLCSNELGRKQGYSGEEQSREGIHCAWWECSFCSVVTEFDGRGRR